MPQKMNKIQIRAEVFATMNGVFSQQETPENAVEKAVERLKEIEDKDFLARLLVKEFISSEDSERSALISLLLINCVPVDNLEPNLWSNLALKTVSDEKKYQLIDILKMMGKFVEYDKYLDYFEEPQNVIDMDTHKILNSAMNNPEAQIDFLDFLSTLNNKDKMLLIESIAEDYSPDDLANILAPIVLNEKDKSLLEQVINLLVKSKSMIAYHPIEKLSLLSKDEKIKKIASKSLKELKFAGITEDKVEAYYKNKFYDSILYTCYSSLVDGKGNQGLLFSRVRADDSIQIFCVVINDLKGIIDCFGFNSVSKMEFNLILDKFFAKNTHIALTFEIALSWLNEAEEITFSRDDTLPYEYICWREILFDVKNVEKSTDEAILTSLAILPEHVFTVDDIFEKNYLDKLYFDKDDNGKFDHFITSIDNWLSAADDINIKLIEKEIDEHYPEIFDEGIKEILKKRILKIAFCLMTNSKMKDASMLYYFTQNDDMMQFFYKEVVKKSIFEFYREEYVDKMSGSVDNIFLKNAKKMGSKLDDKRLIKLLKEMLDAWGRDE